MTVVNVDRTTWTALNAAAARFQIFGGRLRVADSGAPAADDFHVYPAGAVFDATANKFGQAVGDGPTYVVRLAV